MHYIYEVPLAKPNPQGPGPFAKRKDPGGGGYYIPIISAHCG